MRTLYSIVAGLLLVAPAVLAQVTEEVEGYLVTPYTLNKQVTVITTDRRKIEGKVIKGDADRVFINQGGTMVELQTNRILTVTLRRPKRSGKIDFLGSLIGGVALGFAGAAIGKESAKGIRSDGTPGRVGPIVGGVAAGFIGGRLGRSLARRALKEEVTLKVTPEGEQPPSGSPAPTPRK